MPDPTTSLDYPSPATGKVKVRSESSSTQSRTATYAHYQSDHPTDDDFKDPPLLPSESRPSAHPQPLLSSLWNSPLTVSVTEMFPNNHSLPCRPHCITVPEFRLFLLTWPGRVGVVGCKDGSEALLVCSCLGMKDGEVVDDLYGDGDRGRVRCRMVWSSDIGFRVK